MKIYLISDIHFEFHADTDWLPELPPEENFDVLVLAGDIGVGDSAFEGIERILNYYKYVPILLLLGNHEYYHDHIDSVEQKYRDRFNGHDRVHFLEKDTFEYQGYVFIGCVLWSDFSVMGEDIQNKMLEDADEMLSDFHRIRIDNPNVLSQAPKKLSPHDMASLFSKSAKWLNEQLAKHNPLKTIVVTHFPPMREVRNENFAEEAITSYFQANGETIIKKFEPALWLYGHNHYSRADLIGATLLVSNQHGYPNENCLYSPDKIIEHHAELGWQIKEL